MIIAGLGFKLDLFRTAKEAICDSQRSLHRPLIDMQNSAQLGQNR